MNAIQSTSFTEITKSQSNCNYQLRFFMNDVKAQLLILKLNIFIIGIFVNKYELSLMVLLYLIIINY